MITTTIAAAALLFAASAESATTRASGYVTANGSKMYYEVHGSGRPVVLLHGGLSTIEHSFGKLLPQLARSYRVVAVEQVGHGRSPDVGRPYSYAQMADDTAALLATQRIGPADLLGLSDGAIVALLMAIRHPEQVRRVVAVGANARLDGVLAPAIEWVKKFKPDDEALKDMREAYASVSPDGREHWPVFVEKARALLLTPVIIEKEQLTSVRAPTLVISGDRDLILPEHSVELFRGIPGAQLCILPATGHDVFGERSQWALPIVSAFLDTPEGSKKQN